LFLAEDREGPPGRKAGRRARLSPLTRERLRCNLLSRLNLWHNPRLADGRLGAGMADDGSITHWFDSLQAGNREAAQALWLRFANRLIGLARARLRAAPRRAADEEDAVLSAFDSFCRGAEQGRFPQVQDRGDLWNLLVAITVRKVSDQVHHERRQKRGGGAVLGEADLARGSHADGAVQDIIARDP